MERKHSKTMVVNGVKVILHYNKLPGKEELTEPCIRFFRGIDESAREKNAFNKGTDEN